MKQELRKKVFCYFMIVVILAIVSFLVWIFYNEFKPNTEASNCAVPQKILNSNQECTDKDYLRASSIQNTSCDAIRHEMNYPRDGVYTIYPFGKNKSTRAYCDMQTLCGGWTVIQRRGVPGSLSESDRSDLFDKTWKEYKTGFGSPDSDYWLGLDAIHSLTKNCPHEILITATSLDGTSYQARYSNFSVASEEDKFKLTVTGYMQDHSTLRDSFQYNNGYSFTTKDRNNNGSPNKTCSTYYRGNGFWFTYNCIWVSLNGKYPNVNDHNRNSKLEGIYWHNCEWLRLRRTEMKIRSNC